MQKYNRVATHTTFNTVTTYYSINIKRIQNFLKRSNYINQTDDEI